MKVSVVIPTLNEGKRLRRCLESIRSQQTSHEFEIIIVDSYSDDGTLAIAREFTGRIFFTPPGRISLARQKGSEEASGRIIVSAGADNVYDARWLEELVAPIAAGRCVASAGKLVLIGGNVVEDFLSGGVLSSFIWLSFTIRVPFAAGESMAFSKDAFLKSGGYDTSLVTNEDIDLLKKLIKIGRVEYCPKSVARLSRRRIRRWGYPKFVWKHFLNFLGIHGGGKSMDEYERVR